MTMLNSALPDFYRFRWRGRPRSWQLLLLLTVGFTALNGGSSGQVEARTLGQTKLAQAASPASNQATPATKPATPAPDQLKNTLAQIDAAASRENIQGVLQFYTPNFKQSDGLTRQTQGQALSAFWKQYEQLTYRTEVTSWQPQGNGYIAQTVTYITGTQAGPRKMKLTTTLTSQQRLEGQKISSQEILAERTQLTSGQNPPTVDLSLPQQVAVGQTYNLDAIVKEPLGSNFLLGAALEEPITPSNYLKSAPVKLEVLPAGGLFKVGQAPSQPSDRWISAVLIRQDGMTFITQRLRVVNRISLATP